MNEKHDQETLSDLIDNRLSEADVRAVSEHLAGNPGDASLLRELMVVRQRLRGLPNVRPQRDLTPDIMQRIENARPAWTDAPTSLDFVEVESPESTRILSDTALRAIAGVLSFAALVMISIIMFPGLSGRQTASRFDEPQGQSPLDAVAGDAVAGDAVAHNEQGTSRSMDTLTSGGAAGTSSGSGGTTRPNGLEDLPTGVAVADATVRSGDSESERDRMTPPAGEVASGGTAASEPSNDAMARVDWPGEAELPDRPMHPGDTERSQLADTFAESAGAKRVTADGADAADKAIVISRGAEVVIFVRNPQVASPQAWIESIFHEAKLEIEDPSRDEFARKMEEKNATDSAHDVESDRTAPMLDNYYVAADVRQLRFIIEHMPMATFVGAAINDERPHGLSNTFRVPFGYARRLAPLHDRQEPRPLGDDSARVDEVIRSLGIDPTPGRVQSVLFIFHFGDAIPGESPRSNPEDAADEK